MRNKLIAEGKEKINTFFDTDSIKQQKNIDVENAVKQLRLVLKEFDCKQFIILVVGAVKSGKSTLVNLFAHETVSPTHFLECTVRPSIISISNKKEIIRYTFITTQGGILLNKETSIIDMPGLDGSYANFKNPIYAKIAERADIIIFIQNSNSAITNVADDFFCELKKENPKVPIFLLYNVFDSTYSMGLF